jgi:5-formyltetrahydrofolate cyclo-ligase
MTNKESIRNAWNERLTKRSLQPVPWGKTAEALRKLQEYRDAATVFATPAESLLQVRINCLLDGKNLLMPGPGLRNGFYLIKARTVPFRDLPVAVTYKGLEKHSLLQDIDDLKNLSIGLLLTDGLAIDTQGS